MSNDPKITIGSVIKDKGGNLWIVEAINLPPTYKISQIWAGGSKVITEHRNTKFGTWEELCNFSTQLTVLRESIN